MAPDLTRAVSILHSGGLVAFPTETVYGLGANARNVDAMRRLYEVKGRPTSHPVIVHISGFELIARWAYASEQAIELARRFWPGPLTLVLRRHASVLDIVTGGQDSVGLRSPNHPVAISLLTEFGDGIAAPSANRFGRISPTTAQHVRDDLNDDVDLILDGGPCHVGVESTILSLVDEPAVLRPGAITAAQIAEVIGHMPETRSSQSPRAPGALPVHYAPLTPLRIVPTNELEAVVTPRTAVLARTDGSGALKWLHARNDAELFARELYANLRLLDTCGAELILVEAVPDTPEWAAVADRLSRAATIPVHTTHTPRPPGL